MVAIITSAIPLGGTQDKAFTFAIIAMNTEQADPQAIQKWQIDAKKHGLKVLRSVGIDKNVKITKEIIVNSLKGIESNALKSMPKNADGFNFHFDIVDIDDVQELIDLDKTFLEMY